MPDPAQVGWDQHFGYGQPDLGLALERIDAGQDPAAGADHLARLVRAANVEPAGRRRRSTARLSAKRAARLHLPAPVGARASSRPRATSRPSIDVQTATGADRRVARHDRPDRAVRAALDARAGGGATDRPDRAREGPGRQGPERAGLHRARGRHRRAGQPRRGPQGAVRLPRHDAAPGLAAGQRHAAARRRQRLFDLNGDNKLDTSCWPTRAASCTCSSARRHAAARASTAASRCGRRLYPNVHPGAPSYAQRRPAARGAAHAGDRRHRRRPASRRSSTRRASTSTPGTPTARAVAGLPGPDRPGPVAAAGPHARQPHQARLHRLADARRPDGDGDLEIVVAVARPARLRLGRQRHAAAGLPAQARSDPSVPRRRDHHDRRRSATSPATARPDIVTPDRRSSTTTRRRPATPGRRRWPAASATSSPTSSRTCSAAAAACTRSTATATCCPAGRRRRTASCPDALPLVGPGVDHVLANVDSDPQLEVIGNVATGDVTAHQRRRLERGQYDSEPAGGEHVDKSKVINLFENPIVANLDGVAGPEIIKGGVTLNQVVNLGVAVGQNLPYNHVVQAWNAQTGAVAADLPAGGRGLPAALEPGGRGRVRRRRARRSWSAPGSTTCATSTSPGSRAPAGPSSPAAGSSRRRRSATRTATASSRWRRSRARATSFMWDTDRPACGAQRRVVDLPPRRVEHRRLRHRHAAARARRPASACNLQRPSSRTLTWTAPGDDWLCGTAAPLPDRRLEQPIEHPTTARWWATSTRPRPPARPSRHSVADIGQRPRTSPSSTRTTPATGAGSPRPRSCRPRSASYSGAATPGTSFSATSTNVKRASRYFLFFDATARQLMVHMDGNGGGSGSQKVRAMIYSDLAGQPRNLLTTSFETTIQAGRPAGWVGFYLPYTVDFRPGWYWLGIQIGRHPQRGPLLVDLASPNRAATTSTPSRTGRPVCSAPRSPTISRSPSMRRGTERMVPTGRIYKSPLFAARRCALGAEMRCHPRARPAHSRLVGSARSSG